MNTLEKLSIIAVAILIVSCSAFDVYVADEIDHAGGFTQLILNTAKEITDTECHLTKEQDNTAGIHCKHQEVDDDTTE